MFSVCFVIGTYPYPAKLAFEPRRFQCLMKPDSIPFAGSNLISFCSHFQSPNNPCEKCWNFTTRIMILYHCLWWETCACFNIFIVVLIVDDVSIHILGQNANCSNVLIGGTTTNFKNVFSSFCDGSNGAYTSIHCQSGSQFNDPYSGCIGIIVPKGNDVYIWVVDAIPLQWWFM